MHHRIHSVADLGVIVRASRKGTTRIDDFAANIGTSKQFISDLELGKPGVQLGKVLKVLDELGLHLYVDAPASTQSQLDQSRSEISRTVARRGARSGAGKSATTKAPSVPGDSEAGK